MRCTVDASVLVKLVVDEEFSQNAVNLISDSKAVLYAPRIVYQEVGSVLYKMVKRGIIEKKYALVAYEKIIKIPIEIPPEDFVSLTSSLELSLRLGLHFYDCLYIHTAKKTGSVLVSSDKTLLRSTQKECESIDLCSI